MICVLGVQPLKTTVVLVVDACIDSEALYFYKQNV